MLFPLGFTCMFVSLQCFLQHLVQETIWKFFLWKNIWKLVKAKMSDAEFFQDVKIPSLWFDFSNFIFILRQILPFLYVFSIRLWYLVVVWRIPPILSWDHSISNMGTKVLWHISIAYLFVFFYFPQSKNGKWALFSWLSCHCFLVVWTNPDPVVLEAS